jgi:hypothetical protein
MTALAAELTVDKQPTRRFPLKMAAVKAWKGGTACFDTTTGYITKGGVSTTLVPVGVFAQTVDNSGGAAGALSVNVDFITEKQLLWRANDGTVVQATLGSPVYILDDQTVSNTANGGTRSVLGTAVALDTILGVLVAVKSL